MRRRTVKSANELLLESFNLQTELQGLKKPVKIELEIEEDEAEEMNGKSKEKII